MSVIAEHFLCQMLRQALGTTVRLHVSWKPVLCRMCHVRWVKHGGWVVGADAGEGGNQPPVTGDIWEEWNLAGEKEVEGQSRRRGHEVTQCDLRNTYGSRSTNEQELRNEAEWIGRARQCGAGERYRVRDCCHQVYILEGQTQQVGRERQA